MVLRSIKFQLALLTLLFGSFVVIVLFHISYSFKITGDQMRNMKESHEVISRYLVIQQKEKAILTVLHAFVDTKIVTSIELDDQLAKITAWFDELRDWEKVLRKWERASGNIAKDVVFDNTFIGVKKRAAEKYKNVVSLCRDRKMGEANNLLTIEETFFADVNKTIVRILQGIQQQMDSDLKVVKRFSMTIGVAILIALFAIILLAFTSFKHFNKGLRALKKGAKRVSLGEFSESIRIKRPQELVDLGNAFNEMQVAIDTRDKKITEDREEITKLNEILEKKVDDSGKTIVTQNKALKRKNAELEQILHAASHDLRTPLISIQGFSEELRATCEILDKELSVDGDVDKEKLKELFEDEITLALNYIVNGSKRMEILLEGLLRISRMGRDSLKIDTIDMNELAQVVIDTLSIQIGEGHAKFNVSDLAPCKGDSSLVEQVFTNLFTNAIKYREPSRECIIDVSSEILEDSIKYIVKDNGIGISPDNVSKVFNAFYRVDEETIEGDGVGLAIINRALDLHNGKASVESELGVGSTFSFEIPNNIVI